MGFLLAELMVDIQSRGFGALADQLHGAENATRRTAAQFDRLTDLINGVDGRQPIAPEAPSAGATPAGSRTPADATGTYGLQQETFRNDTRRSGAYGLMPEEPTPDVLPAGTKEEIAAAAERAEILAEAMKRAATAAKATRENAREIKVRAAAENLTQGPATVERVSPLEGQLKGLNRERREAARLARLSSFLDIGEFKTIEMLNSVNRRRGDQAEKLRKQAREELDYKIRNTAAARGYGVVQTSLLGVLTRTHAALGNFSRGLARVREALSPVAQTTGRAFGILTAGVAGLVYSGMRGTVELNALTLRFQLLSREIAGVFKPVIDGVIGTLDTLRGWLHGLSDGTKQLIMNMTLGAAAGLGIAKVLSGPLIGGIQMAVAGIGELIAGGLTLDTVFAGLPLILGTIVTGAAALAVGTDAGRKALSGLWETGKKLFAAFQPLLGVFADVAGRVGDMLSAFVADRVNEFTTALGPLIEGALPSVTELANQVSAALDQMLSAFEELGPLVTGDLGDAWVVFFDLVKTGIEQLTLQLYALSQVIKLVRASFLAVNTGLNLKDALGQLEKLDKARKDKREADRARRGGPPGSHELTLAGKGFEGIADTFRRIQSSAVQAGYDKQTADNTKKIAQNTDPKNAVGVPKMVPVVGV